MLDEAEYASDTDESDEDYMPGADGENVGSENESDGEPENALDDADDDGPKSNRRSRKRTATATTPTPTESKRSKSTAAAASAHTDSKSTDKDALTDDDDDERGDALWASFLGNSGQTTPKVQMSKASTSTSSSSSAAATTSNGNSTVKQIAEKAVTKTSTQPTEKKRIVTEIFEFAGEKVEVQKEVKISDEKPAPSNNDKAPGKSAVPAAAKIALPSLNRRSGNGGGLSSVLGQIGKKNKLSVLEKTALDWTGFKRNEGIDEELQTHNKGRDGYLERQDFLQRTDLRQFELEKSMRQTNRRK